LRILITIPPRIRERSEINSAWIDEYVGKERLRIRLHDDGFSKTNFPQKGPLIATMRARILKGRSLIAAMRNHPVNGVAREKPPVMTAA
jgi:hypothetical protein